MLYKIQSGKINSDLVLMIWYMFDIECSYLELIVLLYDISAIWYITYHLILNHYIS